jgi:hypothetical protein
MADLPGLGLSNDSAVVAQTKNKFRDRDNYPNMTEEQIEAVAKEAEDRNVYGHDAKKDRKGNYIQQGIGAPGRETSNHFTSIRRYEGEEAWRKAVAALWKRDPQRAAALNLPKMAT